MTHTAAATAHGRGRRLALLALVTLGLLCAAFSANAYAATDYDGDGAADNDCAPLDPAVYPGAADKPDLGFEDTNCDGMDGDASKAVFVSTAGSDAATGSKGNPLLTINAGITKASADGKDVYVAGGTYNQTLDLADNVGVYGGYVPFSGARSTSETTTVNGAPQAALADGDTAVTLQLLTLNGAATGGAGQSAYGVRAINGSSLVLEGVRAAAGNGTAGAPGAAVSVPAPGSPGTQGAAGGCGNMGVRAVGGPPGALAVPGGQGGQSGYSFGQAALNGGTGTSSGASPGGSPGSGGTANGAVGGPGSPGGPGTPGTVPGNSGTNPSFTSANAGATWSGADGGTGGAGQNGAGGGGGGGGASGWGSVSDPNLDAQGGGGGGGGGGGRGGNGGLGGGAGGGSFAVYTFNSSVVVTGGELVAGSGGDGGNGSAGSNGSGGGAGGIARPGTLCGSASGGAGGAGGNGGTGAPGGAGGGGTGGPSVGVMSVGTGGYVLRSTHTTTGSGGNGGSRGGGGPAAANGSAATSSGSESTGSDADGDGVPDVADACPGVPKGSDADGDGCPDRPAKLVDANGNGVPDSQEAPPGGTTTSNNNTATTTPTAPAPPPAIKGAVRAKGTATATKITFKKLMLSGIPVGASIKVTCKAKSRGACPVKSKALTSKAATLNVLAALLKKPAKTVVFKPGAIVTIKITKSGMTGTSFVFKMVKNKFPKPKRV